MTTSAPRAGAWPSNLGTRTRIHSAPGTILLMALNACARIIAWAGPRAIQVVSTFLGIVLFDLLRVRRKIILANLAIAARAQGGVPWARHGHGSLEAIGRASTVNFVRTTLEFIASRFLFKKLDVSIEGAEHLKAALAKGRGVYALSIHMGNFELGCSMTSRLFARVNAVTKGIGRGAVTRFINDTRTSNGEFEIPNHTKGERQLAIVAALGRGEIIGFMVDQRRSKGMRVPLFGQEALTNTGLYYLWTLHAAPIVPIYIVRGRAPGQHRMVILPELTVDQGPFRTSEDMLQTNAARMNALVEEIVSAHPEDYFWMHNRFKL